MDKMEYEYENETERELEDSFDIRTSDIITLNTSVLHSKEWENREMHTHTATTHSNP